MQANELVKIFVCRYWSELPIDKLFKFLCNKNEENIAVDISVQRRRELISHDGGLHKQNIFNEALGELAKFVELLPCTSNKDF